MHTRRSRSLTAPDARTFVLFSFLLAGCAFAVLAQSPATQPPALNTPATAAPIPSNTLTVAQIDAAFSRADADRNGQISRQEASRFPAVLELFDRMDTDKSGGLSRTEFEAGLKL